MQHQYDNEGEEFEPRITPKPATKVEVHTFSYCNFNLSSIIYINR